MSIVLLKLALKNDMRDRNIDRMGLITNRRHQCLVYSDDIALLARSLPTLKVVKGLDWTGKVIGLKINGAKKKCIVMVKLKESL